MVANPVRDVVYVADQTDARIFAVNTDSGSEVASETLASVPGALAVSPDGNYLYVAEPESFQIQVLSLPNLTSVNTLNIGMVVGNLVTTVNDHLFVSMLENSGQSAIKEIDAQTGAVLGMLPTQYSSPLLRTNSTGTNLYIEGDGFDGDIDAYDVSGAGQPTQTTRYSAAKSGDFLVDESAGRLYAAVGGGVGVTDTDTDTTTSWSFGVSNSGGTAIAALPSAPVYGASGNVIFAFQRRRRCRGAIRGPRWSDG